MSRTETILYRLGCLAQVVGMVLVVGTALSTPEGKLGFQTTTVGLWASTTGTLGLQTTALPALCWWGLALAGVGVLVAACMSSHSRVANWLCARPRVDRSEDHL